MKISGMVNTLLVAVLIITLQAGCTGDKDHRKRPPRKAISEKTLASVTSKLNSYCPEMVDEETRLDSVFLSGEGHLTYSYTLILREVGTFNKDAFQGYIFPRILNNVHANPDLRMHRDSGLIMDFYYRDRNGELITEISIGPDRYR